MSSFIVGFCLLVLVVMVAFHWFPKLATWCAVTLGGLFLALIVQQWSPEVGEVYTWCWLLAVFGLPVWWAVRAARRAGDYWR